MEFYTMFKFVLFLFCLLPCSVHSFEFFTSQLYSGIDYLQCRDECCNPNYQWITPNFEKLKHDLKEKVHGQHLVQKVLINALESHYRDLQPKKALVISLHGNTGTGKNFVSEIVSDALYQKGSKSKYVTKYIEYVHFPHESEVNEYKLELVDKIRDQVTSCEKSLFTFDEVQMLPQGLIDAIKPFIDHHTDIDGVDYRKSIFLFLSNTGTGKILKFLLSWFGEGKTREDISLNDDEHLVEKGAFNEPGGLHMSSLIEGSLVDFYVPFLPMERRHIELCARDELSRLKYVNTDIVRKIADSVTYKPDNKPLFASKGCKYGYKKVSYFLADEEL